MTTTTLDVLTIASLSVGLFFMLIGALGIVRLPDLYSRMHAASKCITLGISGMLIAAVFHFARVEAAPAPAPAPALIPGEASVPAGAAAVDATRASSALAAVTKAILVIIFQFVAAPVAVHMLARAAHLDGEPAWEGMISDELAEDQQKPSPGRR